MREGGSQRGRGRKIERGGGRGRLVNEYCVCGSAGRRRGVKFATSIHVCVCACVCVCARARERVRACVRARSRTGAMVCSLPLLPLLFAGPLRLCTRAAHTRLCARACVRARKRGVCSRRAQPTAPLPARGPGQPPRPASRRAYENALAARRCDRLAPFHGGPPPPPPRQRHAEAQHNVAVAHMDGLGAPADAGLAVEWYRRAAAAGQPESLGTCHANGIGA